MRYVVADFETASRADLQKIGAWKYAADMSTFPSLWNWRAIPR
jgi:hypothetical protein